MSSKQIVTMIGFFLIIPILTGAANESLTKPVSALSTNQEDQTKIFTISKGDMTIVGAANTLNMNMPTYKPPRRGSPKGRFGGSTRGEKPPVAVEVLVPNHAALTVTAQPKLYWYISAATRYPLELTIIEDDGDTPLVKKYLPQPVSGGIQVIRLADYSISLRRDVLYEWSLKVIIDPKNRSKDIEVHGFIEMVSPPPSLQARLKAAVRGNVPHIYAEEGFWLDALEAISDMIEAAPTNRDLRKQRVYLLQQGGLDEIAAFEQENG